MNGFCLAGGGVVPLFVPHREHTTSAVLLVKEVPVSDAKMVVLAVVWCLGPCLNWKASA